MSDMEDDMDMEEESQPVVSRPATSTSRPATSTSRPATSTSRPATSTSRPATATSRPSSGASKEASRPSSGASVTASRPGSSTSTRSRPDSGKSITAAAWEEHEEEGIVDEDHPEAGIEEDEEIDDYDVERLLDASEAPEGCWKWLGKNLSSLWSTKMMEDSPEREWHIKTTIRELTIYVMFICLIVLLCFGPTSQSRYVFKDMVQKHFEDVEKVSQVPEMWAWLIAEDNKGFINNLYQDEWYNDGDMVNSGILCPGVKPEDCQVEANGRNSCEGPCQRDENDANMLYENKLLGVPRLRMVRLRNDSCEVPETFQASLSVCYAHYSEAMEDRSDFGQGWRRFTGADAWRYQMAKEIAGVPYWGKIATYSGGGAVQNLHNTRKQSLAIVKELREGLWIDRATRLIIIDFTLYNANLNMFCIVKIAFEVPPTGGLVVSTNFSVVKLLRYVNAWDHFIFGIEIVFFFFIFYYIIEEILEISHSGYAYFSSMWNCMDILVIIISLCTNAMQLYVNMVVHDLLKPLLAEPTRFGDFTLLSQLAEYSTMIFAINVFFVWIKVFKYISFNKTMNILSSTLTSCAMDLVAFGFMFQIVLLAFIQFAYLVFGAKLKDFSTQMDCMFTLMRALLGDFDFPAMQKATPVGPWFFIFYIFSCFFILLNMFLAIINDTYSEVKAEFQEARSVFEITDYFARGYNNVLGAVSLRDKIIDVEIAIKLANDDGTVTYDEIRKELKKCDFADSEIDMFFGLSDRDGDGEITTEESNDMLEALDEANSDGEIDPEDLEEARMGSGKKDSDIVTNLEFDVLEHRVDKIEHSLGSIISKIDAVLCKMDVLSDNHTQGEEEDAGNAVWLGEEEGATEREITIEVPGQEVQEVQEAQLVSLQEV